MSPSEPTAANLDPQEICEQTAALAAHLQRCGVAFMPRPRAGQVEWLASQFAVAEPVSPRPGSPAAAANPRPAAPVAASRQAASRVGSVAAFTAAEGPYPGDPLPIPQRQSQLDQLALEVATCTRCPILSGCRSQTVFGEGSPSPRFVFFGEGPGADEDRSGRPFVGKAGQLLTKMIEACRFSRQDAYILNTVKCRPPGNRNPEPDEMENCRPYYQQQLNLLRPEYIVCLGAISSQELLKTTLSIGRLRGKLHSYHDSKVLVTYHPAYLLRNPAAKKAAWEDLQLMLRDAGIKL